MSIFKRYNSVNFYYEFMVNGKKYSASTGTANRANAMKFEQRKKEEVYKRVHLGEETSDEITLKDALDQYFDDKEHEKTIKTYATCRTKLLGTKKDKLTKKTVKVFGFSPDMPLHTLGDRDLQKLVTARRKEGNGNDIIIYELILLSVVIKHAKRLGFKYPLLDFVELKSANKLRASAGKIRYLSIDEEKRLLTELSRVTPNDYMVSTLQRLDTYHFVMMLLDTGARHGEIATLKWTDIDLETRSIRLYRTKVQNESTLMMSDRVHALLTDRLSVKRANQIYVFENRAGGAREQNRKAFISACERAKLEGVTYHVLRHTFASRMVQAEVPIYSVQSLLGHANVSTTARYAHLAPTKASQIAVQVLNALNEVDA